MVKQESFGALWNFAAEVREGKLSIQEAGRNCIALRKIRANWLKRQGIKVHCHTLSNQLRPYWGFGVPCGHSCKVYLITFEDNN